MSSTIQIKRGTGSAVPSALAQGELAINVTDGKFYYGDGSSVKSNFKFDTITAQNYIVSSSVTNITTQELSGSTVFGNSSDDSHTFTGNITASGNISSSGNINVSNILADSSLQVAGNRITYANDDLTFLDTGLNVAGGPITASGDISSSGNINANQYNIQGKTLTTFASDTLRHGFDSSLVKYSYGKDSDNEHLFYGNITASADISASGTLTVDTITNVNTTHITASGDISASGIVTTGELKGRGTITGLETAGYLSSSVLYVGNETQFVSASLGNISASGTISAITGSFPHIITTGDTIEFKDGSTKLGSLKFSAKRGLQVRDSVGAANNLTTGDITASGDISGSGIFTMGLPGAGQRHKVYGRLEVIGSDVIIGEGHITASGNISASGDVSAGVNGTGSFDHIITLGDTLEFKNKTTRAKEGSIKFTSRGLQVRGADDADAETVTGNVTASGNISASGNFIGNNIGSGIYDNRIYLTPTDFDHLSDKVGVTVAGEIEGNGAFIADNGARGTYHAQKIIPKGYKATHVQVLGSSTSDSFLVYSSSYDVATAAQVKGATSIDTEVAIDNVIGGGGTYVSVKWGSRGNTDVYGGYIRIIPV